MRDDATEIRIRLAHLETTLSLLEAAPGNERWKELAVVQGNLLGVLRRQLACVACDILSQHIEELKQALPVPSESGCLDVIVAGGGGAGATHACEQCGGTLALLVEPGEPSLMFCMSCQPEVMASLHGTDPDELAAALVRSFLPTPGSIQHFARPRALDEPGSGGGVRARALRADELEDFEACVRFCQREPLPANDKETEHRMQEARERWPAMMDLIGSGWPQ
jgi:hypothetical protein